MLNGFYKSLPYTVQYSIKELSQTQALELTSAHFDPILSPLSSDLCPRTSARESQSGDRSVEPIAMVGTISIYRTSKYLLPMAGNYYTRLINTLNSQLSVSIVRIRYLHGACTCVLARRGDIINMWTSSVQK